MKVLFTTRYIKNTTKYLHNIVIIPQHILTKKATYFCTKQIYSKWNDQVNVAQRYWSHLAHDHTRGGFLFGGPSPVVNLSALSA